MATSPPQMPLSGFPMPGRGPQPTEILGNLTMAPTCGALTAINMTNQKQHKNTSQNADASTTPETSAVQTPDQASPQPAVQSRSRNQGEPVPPGAQPPLAANQGISSYLKPSKAPSPLPTDQKSSSANHHRQKGKVARLPGEKRRQLKKLLSSGPSYREAIHKAGLKDISPQNLSARYKSPARIPTELVENDGKLVKASFTRLRTESEDGLNLLLDLQDARSAAMAIINSLTPEEGEVLRPDDLRLLVSVLYTLPGLTAATIAVQKHRSENWSKLVNTVTVPYPAQP